MDEAPGFCGIGYGMSYGIEDPDGGCFVSERSDGDAMAKSGGLAETIERNGQKTGDDKKTSVGTAGRQDSYLLAGANL